MDLWQKIELGSYLFGQICNYNYSYQDLVRCSWPCFVLLNPFSHEMTSKVPKKKKKNEGFFFSATHPFVFDLSLRKSFLISANMDYVQIYNQKWRFFLFSNTPFCFWSKLKEKHSLFQQIWIMYKFTIKTQ